MPSNQKNNMPFGLSQKDTLSILQILKQFSQIESATVFGSRAMGNFKKGSDVDMALKGSLSQEELRQVSALLNEELPLPYFFDVILYHEINNPDLKQHIDSLGKLFYSRC